MRRFLSASRSPITITVPALLAVIAIYQSVEFAIILSPTTIPEFAFLLGSAVLIIGVIFCSLLFFVSYKIEDERLQHEESKTKTIRAIGDLIGDGIKIKRDLLNSSPTNENFENSLVNVNAKEWEIETEKIVRDYDPKLVPILSDTLGEPFSGKSLNSANQLSNLIDARLNRLRELLILVGMR